MPVYLVIHDVLTKEQLAQLADLFDKQQFVDGRETAGKAGLGIKENLQLPSNAPAYGMMHEMVTRAVMENPQFALAAIPKALRPIRFARYTKGMHYGRHIDNVVMGKNPAMRIDLAFTLFLSDPDSYEGGELVVDEPGTRRKFKLPAGSMVLYNGNSLHEVAEVTSGSRDVAVGWLQSMIRDPVQRRIIFELEDLRAKLLESSGRTVVFDTISRNVADLWRMWVEV